MNHNLYSQPSAGTLRSPAGIVITVLELFFLYPETLYAERGNLFFLVCLYYNDYYHAF